MRTIYWFMRHSPWLWLMMLDEEETRKPDFWQKLRAILSSFIAQTIFIIVAALLIRWAFKKRKRIYELLKTNYTKRLRQYVTRLFGKIKKPRWMMRIRGRDKGYIDEKESLIKFKGMGKKTIGPLTDWFARMFGQGPRWKDLRTNRDRIRYLYRYFILRCVKEGYRFKDILTPRETVEELVKWDKEKTEGADELLSIYERTRYGEVEAGEEQVEKSKEISGFGRGRLL